MWGALLAGAMLVVYILWEIVGHFVRDFRLRHPCKARFLITSSDRREINYAIQDEKEHTVMEIVLPSNSEVNLELLITPKISFKQTELIFGCRGSLAQMPLPISYFVPFIETGQSHWIPGEDKGHYIDHSKNYHVVREKHHVIGMDQVAGFKLKTRSAGTYPAHLSFAAETREGTYNDLVIRVEDKPETRMKCVGHWGCVVKPKRVSTH